MKAYENYKKGKADKCVCAHTQTLIIVIVLYDIHFYKL